MKKLLLISLGLLAGLVIGFLASGLCFWTFVYNKTVNTFVIGQIVAARTELVIFHENKMDLLSKRLESELEAGLLYCSCLKYKEFSKDNVEVLSKVKKYLKDHPISYTTLESGKRIEEMLNSVP